MALIFEAFTDEELNLISGSSTQIDVAPNLGDFVKLSIYDENNNFISSYDSITDKNDNSNGVQYTSDLVDESYIFPDTLGTATDGITESYLNPKDISNNFLLDIPILSGEYDGQVAANLCAQLTIDLNEDGIPESFYYDNTIENNITYITHGGETFNDIPILLEYYNYDETDGWGIEGAVEGEQTIIETITCMKIVGVNDIETVGDDQWFLADGSPQLKLYQGSNSETNNIFIKPNEPMREEPGLYTDGLYNLQISFLKNIYADSNLIGNQIYYPTKRTNQLNFVISEISPSRKEIRLNPSNILGTPTAGIHPFNVFGLFNKINREKFNIAITDNNNEYRFDHVVSLPNNIDLAITNYEFDLISNPNADLRERLDNSIITCPSEQDYNDLIATYYDPNDTTPIPDEISTIESWWETQVEGGPTGLLGCLNYPADLGAEKPAGVINNNEGYGVSLILRLNDPIPNNITTNQTLEINKVVLDTNYQDIIYVSAPTNVFVGGPLAPDETVIDELYVDNGPDSFESKAEIEDKIPDTTLSNISQNLLNKDVNLNVNYNSFNNHTFFGSAKQKLVNFKSKASDIETHLNQISASLSVSGSATGGGQAARRKELFTKIRNIQETFTPYEKFLYYDNQNESTSSAPGLGNNYAKAVPVNLTYGSVLSGSFDGFNVVYKHTTENATAGNLINLFKDEYRAENAPFFNDSGSFYLSFLLRADGIVTGSTSVTDYGGLEYINTNSSSVPPIPADTLGRSLVAGGSYTGSILYKRFIYEASQSYWTPKINRTSFEYPDGVGEIHSIDYMSNNGTWTFNTGDPNIMILSGTNAAGERNSHLIEDTTGLYGDLLTPSMYDTSSGFLDVFTPRTGSILPSGDLFGIYWKHNDSAGSAITSSFITDVKVTKTNPIDILPFGQLYSTGSTKWTNWYDGLYDSASSFDIDNIHSLENNLPQYFREADDSADVKKFLAMLGEHYDLIRNYIEHYVDFNKRGYGDYESPPDNILPILSQNFGWELINPLTSSLAEYFTDVSNGGETVKKVTEQTWRKVLNNLIYIYKSKGTHNSVNALLNIYGFPEDTIKIQEYGGSTEEHNPVIIKSDDNAMRAGLMRQTKNVSFTRKKDIFYTLDLSSGSNFLNLDWATNNVTDSNTIEFVFKTNGSATNQTLLENSGSKTELLWDLNLVTSASKGKLKFRLNNSKTGSKAIATNAVSMSTEYLPITNNKLWNVMLQRLTSSISGTGIQTYKLFTGFQESDKIKEYNVASMSISGGLFISESNYIANNNWLGTGSLSISGSNNLVIGRLFSGSIGDIRVWDEVISSSKFKQHILNKNSVIGNNINSSKNNIYYRFRLNENNTDSRIIDANPRNVDDYSRDISVNPLSYIPNFIENISFTPRFGGADQQNDNKILVDPEEKFIRQLNPNKPSTTDLRSAAENKRKTSTKVDIVRSFAKKIDEYIINNISDIDISDKIADPRNLYSSSYSDLDSLKDTLYQDISVNINEYIGAQTHVFNQGAIQALETLLPGKTQINNIGVVIEPTILERVTLKNPQATLKLNPNLFTGSIDVNTRIDFTGTGIESPYTASLDVHGLIITSGSREGIKTGTANITFDLSDSVKTNPYKSSIDVIGLFDFSDSAKLSPYTSSINVNEYYSFSDGKLFTPYQTTSSIKYSDYFEVTSTKLPLYTGSVGVTYDFSNSQLLTPYTGSLNVTYDLSESTKLNLYDGSTTINYDLSNSSKLDIHTGSIGVSYNLANSKLLTTYDGRHSVTASFDGSKKTDLYIDTITYSDYIELSSAYKSPYTGSVGVTYDFTNTKLLTSYNGTYTFTTSFDGTSKMPYYTGEYFITASLKDSQKITNYMGTYTLNVNTSDSLKFPLHSGNHIVSASLSGSKLAQPSGDYDVVTNLSLTSIKQSVSEDTIDILDDVINFSLSDYQTYKIGSLIVVDFIAVESSKQSLYLAPIEYIDYYTLESSKQNSYLGEYDIETNIDFSNSKKVLYTPANLFLSESYSFAGSSLHVGSGDMKSGDFNALETFDYDNSKLDSPFETNEIDMIGDYYTLTASKEPLPTGIADASVYNSYETKLPWEDDFGNDYHIISWGVRGLNDDYDTGYIERKQVFYMIGDVEYISSSYNLVGNHQQNFNDKNYFANHFTIDKGQGYTYYTSASFGSFNASPIDGRFMGRTAYFVTASDGTLVYPNNHFIKIGTSKDELTHAIYGGTQCVPYSGKGTPDPRNQMLNLDLCVETSSVAGADTKGGIFFRDTDNKPPGY